MDDLFAYGLVIGVIAFLSLLGLTTIEERFPRLKSSKLVQLFQNLSVWALVICGLIVITIFIFSYLSQPSAYEQCVSADDLSDPAAIAWIEEYCASNQ